MSPGPSPIGDGPLLVDRVRLPGGEAAVESLDDTVDFRGEAISLRYVLTHMIEEYARHNGHADLLREAIDGVVGE
ncbi:DUF664 domain-containing protein [Kitasatospora sp. NPDC059408]|uniref:mycothiol transferase n=1 Tax=Kitasatospora sp. NPDC059408 TaxID=3346823 RepID=UPI003696E595